MADKRTEIEKQKLIDEIKRLQNSSDYLDDYYDHFEGTWLFDRGPQNLDEKPELPSKPLLSKPTIRQESVVSGCAIPVAANYHPDNTGCEDGGLMCCDFTNCTDGVTTRSSTGRKVEDCGNDKAPSYPKKYLKSIKEHLVKFRENNFRDDGLGHISIPLIFHDVYGAPFAGTENKSVCETTDCECKAYRATQILSEQYSPGNISYYRACFDENENILSEEECNRGDGIPIPVINIPNSYVHDRANVDTGGWFSQVPNATYFHNAINIYVTECIAHEPEGTSCRDGLNGVACFGPDGDDCHRGIAITHDAFVFGKNGILLDNWGTFGHELAHTWGRLHLFQGVEYVDLTDCDEDGDRICDTEAIRIHGFQDDGGSSYKNSVMWTEQVLEIDESTGVPSHYNAHRYCAFVGEDGFFDQASDTLHIKSDNQGSGDVDLSDTMFGTRDINSDYYQSEYYYQIPNASEKIKAHYWCDYDGTCDELDYYGTDIHNLLSTASVKECRNLGCYETSEHACTPLPAFTPEQFQAMRYDMSGAWNPDDSTCSGIMSKSECIDEGCLFNAITDTCYFPSIFMDFQWMTGAYPGVTGCANKLACNYSPRWIIHDESQCIYLDAEDNETSIENSVCGCTIEGTCSYNENAITDNGSCRYPTPAVPCNFISTLSGCTDEDACNYNPEATENDGSCEYFEICDGGGMVCPPRTCDYFELLTDCTDPTALNYNPQSVEDDGSCLYEAEWDKLLYNGWPLYPFLPILSEQSTSTGVTTYNSEYEHLVIPCQFQTDRTLVSLFHSGHIEYDQDNPFIDTDNTYGEYNIANYKTHAGSVINNMFYYEDLRKRGKTIVMKMTMGN